MPTQASTEVRHFWNPPELLSVTQAAEYARCHPMTIRDWCAKHHVGWRSAGRFVVSAVGIDMLLSGDEGALAKWRAGKFTDPAVTPYYVARGIALPRSGQIGG